MGKKVGAFHSKKKTSTDEKKIPCAQTTQRRKGGVGKDGLCPALFTRKAANKLSCCGKSSRNKTKVTY